MKATELLHNLGQSIWLDNIRRDLLDSGTLKRYIDELLVTGLTSNPTIFNHAVKNSTAYDAAIREDTTRAADLFRADLRLAARLQEEGARSFVNSWNELMGVIASKSAAIAAAR
jgi:transaldolase